MADWNQPTILSLNTDVLANLKSRDLDVARLFKDAPANPVDGMIRIVREADKNADSGARVKIQEYDGAAWQDRPIAVEGGGTGKKAINPSALGLGTMSSQDSNKVAITGGTIAAAAITGVLNSARIPSFPASKVTSGVFHVDRIPKFDASKINTGLIDDDRLPALVVDDIPDLSTELVANSFNLSALTKVTKTLSADLSKFRFIMIIGGDNTNVGRGLGSTMIPFSAIPFSDGTPDQYLYGITSSGDANISSRLYRINQANGAILEDIGSLGARVNSSGELDGSVYALISNRGLYSVNLQTGAVTLIGGSTYSDARVSLGSADGVLYVVESSDRTFDLYSLNVTTGNRTSVRDNFAVGIESLGGLGSVLYGTSYRSDRLYSNLQSGGTIVNVGALGVTNIKGLAGVGNILYGIRSISDGTELYSINVNTGVARSLGTNNVNKIGSLAGLDAGVADSARIHIIPSKRVDIWRPTNTTNKLGFYSDRSTTIVRVIGLV